MGFDFSVGFKKQVLTFIYVKDLVKAVMDALDKAPRRKTYLISEKRSYTQKEFRKIVSGCLGKKFVIPVCCPLWMLYAVSVICEYIGKLTLKPSTLESRQVQDNETTPIGDATRVMRQVILVFLLHIHWSKASRKLFNGIRNQGGLKSEAILYCIRKKDWLKNGFNPRLASFFCILYAPRCFFIFSFKEPLPYPVQVSMIFPSG